MCVHTLYSRLKSSLSDKFFSFFFRCVDAVVGWAERVIRMGGELYHGEIGDVYEMFAVVVALIYREALFDRADIIVLCAAYLGLKRSVAEVAHNHAVFAVGLELRAGLKTCDIIEARSGLYGRKNTRLFEQAGAEIIMDGLRHIGRVSLKPTRQRPLSRRSRKPYIAANRDTFRRISPDTESVSSCRGNLATSRIRAA